MARWKLAKAGTLWYWVAPRSGNAVLALWHYRDGKWAEKKASGSRSTGTRTANSFPSRAFGKLFAVNGTRTKEFTFSDEEAPGFTAAPKGAVVWAQEDRLFCLEPGTKPVLFGGLRGMLK